MTLIEAMATMTMVSMLSIGSAKVISQAKTAQSSTRQLSIFQNSLRDLKNALQNESSCELTGLVGQKINPASPESSGEVTLHVPYNAASTNAVIFAKGQTGANYKIDSVLFTYHARIKSSGGESTYFSRIEITAFPLVSQNARFPLQRSLYLKLLTDSSNKIISCRGNEVHAYRFQLTCDNTDESCNLQRSCPLSNPVCKKYENFFPYKPRKSTPELPNPPDPSMQYRINTSAACPEGMRVLSCNLGCEDKKYQLLEATSNISKDVGDDICFTACSTHGPKVTWEVTEAKVKAADKDYVDYWNGGTGPITTLGFGARDKNKAIFLCTPK